MNIQMLNAKVVSVYNLGGAHGITPSPNFSDFVSKLDEVVKNIGLDVQLLFYFSDIQSDELIPWFEKLGIKHLFNVNMSVQCWSILKQDLNTDVISLGITPSVDYSCRLIPAKRITSEKLFSLKKDICIDLKGEFTMNAYVEIKREGTRSYYGFKDNEYYAIGDIVPLKKDKGVLGIYFYPFITTEPLEGKWENLNNNYFYLSPRHFVDRCNGTLYYRDLFSSLGLQYKSKVMQTPTDRSKFKEFFDALKEECDKIMNLKSSILDD